MNKTHIISRVRTVCGLKLTDDRNIAAIDVQATCENCLSRLVKDQKRMLEMVKKVRDCACCSEELRNETHQDN